MRQVWRKPALTVHVISSVGWLGAVAAYLVMAVAGIQHPDTPRGRGLYLAMDLISEFAIVPMALASLLTGVACCLSSPWGLLRHYWVLIKLLLTTAATAVLLLHRPTIGYLAEIAAGHAPTPPDITGTRASLIIHAAGGIAVLIATTVLATVKPRGTTGYGRTPVPATTSGSVR